MRLIINSLKVQLKDTREKHRLAYIILLVISGILILTAVYLYSSQADLDQSQKLALITLHDRYIIKFDLLNNDNVEYNYRISVTVDGKKYDEDILIRPEGVYTYRHQIYPPLKDKMINISIFRENEPVSENTYLLD